MMKKITIVFVLISGFLLLSVSGAFAGECVKGDCINGKGTYEDAYGNKYDGEWKYGKRHGKGTLTLKTVL